ncbi:MAG TPA: gamma-glutamylcyclotransferase family protein [Haliangiales bacterium]|nr:gamma-glutamylcyclotransferase family protein [Haliangiales bacterium]
MSYRYFCYGSSLDAQHFAGWANEHGYGSRSLGEGQPAMLSDYELSLTVPSRYWMGAVGTLAPRPGAVVHGVLYALANDDADMIRHKEGVASGLYREIDVEVEVGAGPATTLQLVRGHTFVAAPERTSAAPPAPSRRWLESVVRGGRAHGLPAAWTDELARLLGG